MTKLRKKKPRPPRKKTPAAPWISTSYLARVYYIDDFVKSINRAAKVIGEFRKKHPFDAIAFTGCSGAAFAYPLSAKMKIPLICVRKKDGSHNDRPLEGFLGAKKFLIVDDFIASGGTIRKIVATIKKHAKMKNKYPKPVGVFLYDHGGYLQTKICGVPIIRLNKSK